MIRHVPIDDLLKDFGDNGQDTGWSIVIFLWTSSFSKNVNALANLDILEASMNFFITSISIGILSKKLHFF